MGLALACLMIRRGDGPEKLCRLAQRNKPECFSALYFVFPSRFSCDIRLFWHLFASSFQIKSKGTDLSQGFSADQTLHNDAYLRTEHKTTSASITRR